MVVNLKKQLKYKNPKVAKTQYNYRELVKAEAKGRLSIEKFKEVSHRGQKQQHFTTIDFGYSPYIPTSQQYVMEFYGAGAGTILGANDMGKEEKIWINTVQDWQEDNEYSLETALNDVETQGLLKSRAEELGKHLGRLLEQEGPRKEYLTSVRGEIEQEAMVKYLLEDNPHLFPLRQNQIRVRKFIGDTLGRKKYETFDLIAKDEKSRNALDLSLKMLTEKGMNINIDDIQAIETTNMTKGKIYLQQSVGTLKDNITTLESNWQRNVEWAYQKSVDDFDLKGKTWEEAWHAVTSAPVAAEEKRRIKGNPLATDTINYAAQQMLSRFLDLQNNTLGGAFIIQAPVTKYHSGYAIIRPQWKDTQLGRILVGVDTETAVLGAGDWSTTTFHEMVGADTSGIFQGMGAKVGVGKAYSTHGNMLLYWASQQKGLNNTEASAVAQKASQDVANELSLVMERDDIYGLGMAYHVQSSVGDSISMAPTVQLASFVSSQDAADLIQQQVLAFFENSGTMNALKMFYINAMKASNKITDAWKSILPNSIGPIQQAEFGAAGLSDSQPFGPPYITPKSLEGIGTPFFMTYGVDEGAFQAFKGRYIVDAKTTASYKKKMIIEPRTLLKVRKAQRLYKGKKKGLRPFYV